jgi:cytochrome c biogenesis protein CcmG, thiol:disulfide interchange protein DsbE
MSAVEANKQGRAIPFVRFLIPIVFFALLVVVLSIGIKHSPDVGTIHSPLVGRQAPAWELPTLTDAARTIGSKELSGRWYVLNVWGTWCAACRQEHTALLELQRTSSVPIVGMDWHDDAVSALDWLSRLGNPYSVVAVDRDGSTAVNFGVYGAPETFLVSPTGRIVHKHIGPLTLEIWRKDFVSRMGPGAPASS